MQRLFQNFLSSAVLMLGLVLITPAHAAEAAAKAWLETMSFALQQLSYEGVFVYRRDDELAAMRVRHYSRASGESEIITTLTGEARESSRASSQFQILGGGPSAAGFMDGVEKQYKLVLQHQDRVAGRKCQVLDIIPRDQYRYGYRLWLDMDSALLLKSDLMGQDGQVLEQVMFTSMTILNDDSTASDAVAVSPLKPGKPQQATSLASSQWKVGQIPGGFDLVDVKTPDVNHGVEHMIFSDGLASVSIFIEENRAERDPFVGVSRMGAVNAFGELRDGYQVTVVGEVPEATVRLLGQSLSKLELSQ